MRVEHLERVAAIEVESFTTPRSEETFRGLLDRKGVVTRVLLAEDREVIGYSILWCILDQGELANIAIAPMHRGQGHGRRMLERVMAESRERGVEELFLEVRASNTAALSLYESLGFTQVGLRRNYYDRPPEDALLMVANP